MTKYKLLLHINILRNVANELYYTIYLIEKFERSKKYILYNLYNEQSFSNVHIKQI